MSARSIHAVWGFRVLWSPVGDDTPAEGAGGGAGEREPAAPETVERDLLVNRLIEGRATPGDWLDLRDSVTADPALWEHLSAVQGEAGMLCTAVGGHLALAERVELPVPAGGRGAGAGAWPSDDSGRWRRRWGWMGWGGWAVAAVLGLVFVGTQGLGGALGRGGTGQAGVTAGLGLGVGAPSLSGDYQEALERYVQMGQEAGSVLGELPHRVVVSTQPTEDGRIEVVYIRQLLERTIVDQAFRLGTDEAGRPRLVPSVNPGVGEGGSPL
jgi:hypothetical protein